MTHDGELDAEAVRAVNEHHVLSRWMTLIDKRLATLSHETGRLAGIIERILDRDREQDEQLAAQRDEILAQGEAFRDAAENAAGRAEASRRMTARLAIAIPAIAAVAVALINTLLG